MKVPSILITLSILVLWGVSPFSYGEGLVRRPLLGYSYDLEKQSPISPVLDANTGAINYGGSSGSSTIITNDISAEQYLAALGVRTNAGFSLAVFEINGGVEVATQLSSDDLTLSTTFEYIGNGREAYLDGASFTPEAKQVLENDHPELKKAKFGHGFIHGVSLSAKLVVTLSITFNSQESKSEFKGHFNMDIPAFLKVQAEGGVKHQRLARSSRMRIGATQIGGNPGELTSLLGAEGKSRSFVECNAGKFDQCHNLVNQLMDYGSKFGKSIRMVYDTQDPYGPAITLQDVQTYDEYGLRVSQTMTAMELEMVEETRQGLMKKYLELKSDRAKIGVLTKMDPPGDELERLNQMSSVIDRLINRVSATAKVCFQKPGQCLARAAGERDLKDSVYNRKEIGFEWGPFHYCEYDKEDAGVLRTIKRARKAVEGGDQMSCRKLDEELRMLNFLDLSFQTDQGLEKISDLRPLRGLKNIEWLDLSGQAVGQLDVLGKCEKLTRLEARANKVKQLLNFALFPSLRYLDLAFNPTMRISHLSSEAISKSIANLEFVNVRHAIFADGSGSNFCETMERNGKLKRYANLFTSDYDVCEKHRRSAMERGIIGSSLYEKMQAFDLTPEVAESRNRIFVECDAKIEL